MKTHLPWILVGVTGATLVGVLIYSNHKKAPLLLPPSSLAKSKLDPKSKAKVEAKIATTSNPSVLRSLASGLQQLGHTAEAHAAATKASLLSPTATTVSPPPSNGAATLSLYKVAAQGDIPGAIAKRFGLALSELAKANGTNAKRIMAGQIYANETLKLPPNAVDGGKISHASGVAS